MERNQATARHSWARQQAWLLLSFFPFPLGYPMSAGCTFDHIFKHPTFLTCIYLIIVWLHLLRTVISKCAGSMLELESPINISWTTQLGNSLYLWADEVKATSKSDPLNMLLIQFASSDAMTNITWFSL